MQRSRCVSRERFDSLPACRNRSERIGDDYCGIDRVLSVSSARRESSLARRREHTRGAQLAGSPRAMPRVCRSDYASDSRSRELEELVLCSLYGIDQWKATVRFDKTRQSEPLRFSLGDSRGSRDAAGSRTWSATREIVEIRISIAPGAIRERIVEDHRFWRADTLARIT